MPHRPNQTESPAFPDLYTVLDALPSARVVVIGDVMLDRFIYGDVSRISPEAPIPVLRIRDENSMLGGAGNVLSNLHGLDAQAVLVAVVGDDLPGQTVAALVAEKGADASCLVRTSTRPTTIKTRFLAAHQQLLRTDAEDSVPIDAALEQHILDKATHAMDGAGAMVLSDYGKGALTPALIARLVGLARARGIPVLVDPKGRDYTIYRGASLVTPNRKELSEAVGDAPTLSDREIIDAATRLIGECGIDSVVATRSQDGMSVIARDAEPVHMRTEALEVFDVSGAGDTVIATIAAVLATGGSLLQAAAIANSAGGIVVAKVGTAAIRRAELKETMARKEFGVRPAVAGMPASVVDRAREAPVCEADEAAEQIQRWKARGLKVGFTNGCFDILHPGHVGYLNRARDKCDRLVIGLNCDASVRRLKGPERPVNAEDARANVLAALGAVDMVVLFGYDAAEDDKPVRLVQRLRPDIFFKGGDYREEQLPEAQAVRAFGGEVELMPLYEGHSTTATISRMKGLKQ